VQLAWQVAVKHVDSGGLSEHVLLESDTGTLPGHVYAALHEVQSLFPVQPSSHVHLWPHGSLGGTEHLP
jgi:hypothetical protein